MTGRLEGKVAFITGAGRGQGRSHAVVGRRSNRAGPRKLGVTLVGHAGPLNGIQVLDLTRVIMGPLAIRIPADQWSPAGGPVLHPSAACIRQRGLTGMLPGEICVAHRDGISPISTV